MKRSGSVAAAWLAWAGATGAAPAAPLPPVNLTVEVRVIAEASAGTPGELSVGTAARPVEAPLALQVQVLNDHDALLRLNRRLPVQWVQAASRGDAASAPGAAPGSTSGSVLQAVTWVSEGQGLWLHPRWPGGGQPVQVSLRFDSATLQPTEGSTLPTQQGQQAATVLQVAPGRWTTFAATGAPAQAQAGTVTTLSLSERGRQLMQLRVTPP